MIAESEERARARAEIERAKAALNALNARSTQGSNGIASPTITTQEGDLTFVEPERERVACVGDRETYNPCCGPCSTYVEGGENHNCLRHPFGSFQIFGQGRVQRVRRLPRFIVRR